MRMLIRIWFIVGFGVLISSQAHAANLRIPVGDSHNCVALSDGTAQCWGNNASGQLGNGSTLQSAIPVVVNGLNGLNNIQTISTGYYHTCALSNTGLASCWGSNNFGQLGRSNNLVTTNIIGNVVSLSAGGFHTCAALTDGTVWCWGNNTNGQLGNGTWVHSSIPVVVKGINNAIAVSAGTYHSCALLHTGAVQCWGNNDTGQIGNGSTGGDISQPVAVSGISIAMAIAAGRDHSCAVMVNGSVQCWGSDTLGQLGNGLSAASASPVTVVGIPNAKTIAAGASHTCITSFAGSVQCWGANQYGQLGNGGTTDSNSPTLMKDVLNAIYVIAGYYHSCAVLAGGGVQCSGENTYGQLGNGTNTDSWIAQSVVSANPRSAQTVQDLFSWKIPAKLSALNLTGASTLQSSGSLPFVAKAVYTDNISRIVPVVWRSSNPQVASVNAAGILTAGLVAVDTPITLSASFTENGVTVQASIPVTITATPVALSGLEFVAAKDSVQSGGQMRLALNAVYSDGSSKPVLANSYALSNASLGSINAARGVLTLATVTTDTPLTVTAHYTERGVNQSASTTMTIVAAPATLSRMTLVGTQTTLMAGDSLNLSAQGLYSDGSRKIVNATWQVSGTAATISSSGVLTAKSMMEESNVIVTASYTNPLGVTVNAEFLVLIKSTLQPPAPPIPIYAEVETTGLHSDFGLSLWSTLNMSSITTTNTATATATTPRAAAAPTSYKMFVAALVPGGSLVTSPTLFFLNRSAQWELASFPLPEYLSNVADNSTQWIELFDHLDSNIIKGTQFFVGYGITDTEMIESGRFQMVYQLQ